MSQPDQCSRSSLAVSVQELAKAIEWLLTGIDWQHISFRQDCGWTVRGLVTAALYWAWSGEVTLHERLRQALEVGSRVCGRGVPRQLSYQAFIKLLVRWTERLRTELVRGLQTRMEQEFPRHFRVAGLVVLAGDGSKIALPRTASNEARFSPAKTRSMRKKKGRSRSRTAQQQRARAKKADSPQLALTMLFHLGQRLPWDWRIGASDASEREHLLQMIADLPPDALITADCGFVGYDFWSALLASQRQFVIRVGGNVRLLRKLGVVRESAGTVYLWPDQARQQKQQPLVLRLVEVHDGRRSWFLVTSVCDPRQLSDQQMAEIYRRRWGIEVFFRQFKQTFGRAKLRSHQAEHASCELHWSLLGLWTLLLYARKQQPTALESPLRLSVARVLRAFEQALTGRLCRDETLTGLLAIAVVDTYCRRDKRSRGYPRKKYDPPTKAPHITTASQAERTLAQQLTKSPSKKGLSA